MKSMIAFVLIACLASSPLFAAVQSSRGMKAGRTLTLEQVAQQIVHATGKLASSEDLKNIPPDQLSAAMRIWERAYESSVGTSAEILMRISVIIPLTGEFYVNGKFNLAKSSEFAARMKSVSTDMLDSWQRAADWFEQNVDRIAVIWLMVWQPMFDGAVLKPELARRQLNRLRFVREDAVAGLSTTCGISKIQAAFALIKVDSLFEQGTIFQPTVFENALPSVEKIVHSSRLVTQAASATEGLAAVELQNGRWGYIDRTGKFAIKPEFDLAYGFSEGIAAVMLERKWGFIDKTGKFFINPQFEEVGAGNFFDTPLAVRSSEGRWGFADRTTGRLVIKPQFDDAHGFREGLAAVRVGEKWGFINKMGQFVIPLQYDNATWFAEGLAGVMVGGLAGQNGYIDKSGKFVIRPQFEIIQPFSEGLAAVEKDGRIGFVTPSGQFVIRPQFHYAGSFQQGFAVVSDGTLFGYLTKSGQVSIPLQFIDAGGFWENLAAVKLRNGKWGFVDQTGKIVIPAQFDESRGFSRGLASVQVNSRWGYIDKTGRMVIAPQFKTAMPFLQ